MKIGDCVELINGRAFKPTDWEDNGLPIVRIQNLNDISATFNYYSKKTDEKYIINNGTLLFSWSGTPGTSFGAFIWNRGKAILNQHIFKVIPKIKINQEYLKFLLNANLNTIISKSHGGVGLQHITKNELEKIEIKIDDCEKQEKIVSKLNKILETIDLRKKQLEDLDNLIKSLFVEMFGEIDDRTKIWKNKKWQDVVTIQNGRDYKKIKVESGGYPVYGTGGEIARASKYLCPENTIIVGRKGSINNPVLVKEKFWNVDTAFGVIPGNELHYMYFYYFCYNFNFMKLNKATTLPSTTKADLMKIEMNIPPIELQKEFANKVEQIDKQKFEIQKSLDKMNELYESLMNQYFG